MIFARQPLSRFIFPVMPCFKDAISAIATTIRGSVTLVSYHKATIGRNGLGRIEIVGYLEIIRL